MKTIKNITDIKEFNKNFHFLHDCSYYKINYDVVNDKIILTLKLFWKKEINIAKENNYIILTFHNIVKYKINDIHSWDFIYKIYLNFIKHNNKNVICFADDKNEPNIYILCSDINYELISNK